MSNAPAQHVSGETEKLTDHNYDGIQEYDNPTPGWWTWLFVLSVVFAVLYMFVTLMARGSLGPIGQYDYDVVLDLQRQFGEIGDLQPDEQTIIQYMGDERWRSFGRNVFQINCASCHGGNGEGVTAPNLTDDAYLHVEKIEDIAKVVDQGVVGKGMPAWGNRLHPNEVVLVSSYVASMRGQNQPGKSAEGELIAPWPGGE